jgi:hypothetical protein
LLNSEGKLCNATIILHFAFKAIITKKIKKISFKKTRNVFILLLIFTILLKECLGSEKKRERNGENGARMVLWDQ